MLDSILIGMTGMEGFSRGLKVISNNVANLNTPGFKSSTIQFTDAYYQQGGNDDAGAGSQPGSFGTGLSTLQSAVNFQPGSVQQTGNPLDVSVGGDSFLVVQDKRTGATTYTRDGQLQFDTDGFLASKTTGKYVMGYATDGSTLTRITLDGLKINPAKATATVKFTGTITTTAASGSTVAETPVDNVVVHDQAGTLHSLKVDIKNNGSADLDGWTVTVTENGFPLGGGGRIAFRPTGEVDPNNDTVTFHYGPANGDIKLDFSSDVRTGANGDTGNIKVLSQDGYAAGSITNTTFNADGQVSLTYTNGQSTTGPQLALARVDAQQKLTELGHGEFGIDDPSRIMLGHANKDGFGSVTADGIEMSNVDLSGEFSNLIIMQRGYQAASNVLSTANDMLQQLFQLHGGSR